MASIASTCRLSARVAGRQLRQHGSSRGKKTHVAKMGQLLTGNVNSFPSSSCQLGCDEFHHAGTVSDDDRGEYCELEG